ncbi:MAG: reverse transcriptase family protein, partial [Candidatus Thermoplasmatota archaeon]|nr:reverse transcriptase family protein [Candidatus Thermoplasmatota archaeon]
RYDSAYSYRTFRIKKKSGGYREIRAPTPDLKRAQKDLLRQLEGTVPVSPFSHGFVKTRNSVTAAMPHIGKELVINMDIKDFFPSITKRRMVKVLKETKEMDPGLTNAISLLCFVPYEEQWALPQGAPTSPYLSNIFLRDMDWRIGRYGIEHYTNFDYTRYADDLTISADDRNVRTMIKVIGTYLENQGLTINKKKLRIMRPHRRQEVCGIVVNKKINLPRKYRKIIRAMKHQKNMTKSARGHYSHEHSVYEIDYDTFRYRTSAIVTAWKVQKRLSEG